MKKYMWASKPFIIELINDFMMILCIVAPVLIGMVFKFLIPELEETLCASFSKEQILVPYYGIFDMILALMTTIMFCFAGVMVMLEEFDNGTAKYYFVTPSGKSGYAISRLVLPAIVSVAYDLILLRIFALTNLSYLVTFIFSISGGLMAIICALIVVDFAKNKIEGMALIKMCGLLVIGIPIAYFVKNNVQYLFSPVPSFWLAKFTITGNYIFILPTLITSVILIWLLYYRFEHKMSR